MVFGNSQSADQFWHGELTVTCTQSDSHHSDRQSSIQKDSHPVRKTVIQSRQTVIQSERQSSSQKDSHPVRRTVIQSDSHQSDNYQSDSHPVKQSPSQPVRQSLSDSHQSDSHQDRQTDRQSPSQIVTQLDRHPAR